MALVMHLADKHQCDLKERSEVSRQCPSIHVFDVAEMHMYKKCYASIVCMCCHLQNGLTLLHHAAMSGSVELVTWLVEDHQFNVHAWDTVSV